MFMVLKEDIQNLVFKCEKILEANNVNLKRLKKEEKMLSKVIKDYVVSDENSIIFNEITDRHFEVVEKISTLKCEEKRVKRVISKIIPLLKSLEIVEVDESEDIEIGQLQ